MNNTARQDGTSARRKRLFAAIVGGVVMPCSAVCLADGLRYVSSRQVILSAQPPDGVPVTGSELWLSRDGGKSWTLAPAEPVGPTTLRFSAAEDGWYGFYFILRNAAGASGDAPAPGTEPHTVVIVDTAAPLFQIHPGATPVRATAGQSLRLRVSLFDEHFSPQGLRVFYRASSDSNWTDGGRPSYSGSEIVWQVPAALSGSCRLRLVAADLAGNRTVEELNLELEPSGPHSQAQALPAVQKETAVIPVSGGQAAENRQEASAPVACAPSVPDPRCQRIRKLAAQLAAQGRLLYAMGRLEDAVRQWPDDADLLSDLGRLLCRRGQYQEAEARFQAALRINPEHIDALRGLALVSSKQNRYADACGYLRRLLQQEPQSAEVWLELGDLEHRLGQVPEAVAAWQQAAQAAGADQKLRESAQRRLRYLGMQDQP